MVTFTFPSLSLYYLLLASVHSTKHCSHSLTLCPSENEFIASYRIHPEHFQLIKWTPFEEAEDPRSRGTSSSSTAAATRANLSSADTGSHSFYSCD